MAGEKRRGVLGDYFTLQRGTTYKSSLLGQPGPVLLGLATIRRDGGFRSDSLQTYGGESPDKLLVRPGDLYLSLKDVTQSGDLLGAVARLPQGQLAGRLTQDTVKLEPKSQDVPVDYLYWLLRAPQYRAYCRAHATGTTNLGLSREDFLAFPAAEPTSLQFFLVEALGALDDKIELNRRMSDTLEAISRALFSERQSAEEWPVARLGDVCDVYDGPHATPRLTDEGPIFLGIANLSNGLLDLNNTNHVTDEDFAHWTRRVTPSAGDLVFSYETRLGQAALIPPGLKCCLGRRMGLLRVKGAMVDPIVLLRAYLSPEFQETIRQLTIHGSTVDRIPLKDFGEFPIRLPPTTSMSRFASNLRPMRDRVEHIERENDTLAEFRDTLLPNLISGELRVPVVERLTAGYA